MAQIDLDARPTRKGYDRLLVGAALATVIALSWFYLLAMVSHTMQMQWSALYFAMMLIMWIVMMAAMMLPSAAPMIFIHAHIGRRQSERGGPPVATGFFVLGYVAVWSGFSFVATLAQWALREAALLSPMMHTTSRVLAGSLLLAAGFYQFTPLKNVCLRNCRSPLQFVLTRWRSHWRGAFAMGLEHGAYCVGCCWALMALLFVGGVMNLWWVIGIAVYVLLEKILPPGVWLGRAFGAALVVAGALVLIGVIPG